MSETITQWHPPANNTGMELLPTPAEPEIVHIGGVGAVSSPPTRPTTFNLGADTCVTQIVTYHYGAKKRPGTIALQHADGRLYGPWQAAGAVGQGNVVNAYWWAQPHAVLKPGQYTVVDSDPSTWSRDPDTAGAGVVLVWGRRHDGDHHDGDHHHDGDDHGGGHHGS